MFRSSSQLTNSFSKAGRNGTRVSKKITPGRNRSPGSGVIFTTGSTARCVTCWGSFFVFRCDVFAMAPLTYGFLIVVWEKNSQPHGAFLRLLAASILANLLDGRQSFDQAKFS